MLRSNAVNNQLESFREAVCWRDDKHLDVFLRVPTTAS